MQTPSHRPSVTVSDEELAARCAQGRVVVIDDDVEILSALSQLIEMEGYACERYDSALRYLQVLNFNRPCFPGPCCVLCDVKMPELDGLELQSRLAQLDDTPLILMSGVSGAPEAVSAFRAGAIDFLIKPVDADTLLGAVAKALRLSVEQQRGRVQQASLAARLASLTHREREVGRLVAQGQTNVVIGEALGIALRTVKLHRQRVMEKMGAATTADLVRMAWEAGW
jgi:FixJ family two-component response regulator